MGMHYLAFPSGFSFLTYWKERKDLIKTSRWKWKEGGYSHCVTHGSVPLRNEKIVECSVSE